MKIKFFLMSCMIVVLSAQMVQAEDGSIGEGSSDSQTTNWGGFFVGLGVGTAKHLYASELDKKASLEDKQSALIAWPVFSGFVGYNALTKQGIVFGFELDGYLNKLRKNNERNTLESIKDIQEQIGVAGVIRVGVGVQSILPYMLFGASFMSILHKEAPRIHNILFGFTAGIGLDFMIINHVVLKLEYRYNRFGPDEIYQRLPERDLFVNNQDVRLGLYLKF